MTSALSLSVVVPSFNTSTTFFERCISSIKEERKRIERFGISVRLVVVDDGSRNTETLAFLSGRAIDETWIDVVRFSDNRGASFARNAGIDRVDSTWVAFLDSDDFWLAGGISELCNEMRSDRSIEWIGGDLYMQYGEVPPVERACFLNDPSRYTYVAPAYETKKPIRLRRPVGPFLDRSLCSMGSCVISRAALAAVGKFDVSLRKGDDTELYWRLARYCDFVFLPRPIFVYCRTQGSTTMDGRPLAEWEPARLKAMLADPSWRPYRAEIRHRLLRTLANLSVTYRKQGSRRLAIKTAMDLASAAPLHPATWLHLARLATTR